MPTGVTIYVELAGEGVRVWRPVVATPVGQATYRLPDHAPMGEEWVFPPGSTVAVVEQELSEGAVPVAYALADLAASWSRTETHLRAALDSAGVSTSDHQEVQEYLDHNELGLAFETLVAVLLRGGEAVSPEVRGALVAAASEMNIEYNNEDLARLFRASE